MEHYSVKEVMELTGVSRDMLIEYEKRGLIHPIRTGDVANNRRLYRDEDIDDLGRVVALRAYDFSLNDIARILGDDEADIYTILQEQLEVLRRRENHLRNLILFAKFVDITDTDLFIGLLEGPSDIDAFADAMRESEPYQEAMVKLQDLTEEKVDAMIEELYPIIYDFVNLEETDGFAGVEDVVDRYFAWWCEHFFSMEDAGYLGFWAVFEDDGFLPAVAEGIGEELISGALQMSAFYVYMKRLMLQTQERVQKVAKLADTDVAAMLVEMEALIADILKAMRGTAPEGITEDDRQLCDHVLGQYMPGMLADGELMGYVDPTGAITLDAETLEKVRGMLEFMPVDPDEGAGEGTEASEGADGCSEGDEGADLRVQSAGDA